MFSALDQFSDRTALITESRGTLTYGDLIRQADQLAEFVTPRTLIISLCTNTAASVTGYVGFMRRGAVQLLVGETIDPEFLSRLIEIYRPQYLYRPSTNNNQSIQGELVHSFGGYDLLALQTASDRKTNIHSKLSLLLSTSGSTGNPKLVRISSDNLKANTNSIIASLGMQSDDRAITTMPMNYSYGLSILNTHLTLGASIVLTDASAMSRDFWTILKENSVTNFGGVPYFYEMLKKLRFGNLTLPSMRFMTQAGGKLNAVLAEEFGQICQKKSIRFFVMYGQTEATARMSCLCLSDHLEKSGSIGKAIPNGEFWLVDEHGKAITEANTPGELMYRGPNVSLGFAETPLDLAAGDEHGSFLKTGDIAHRDQDGFFYIVGRKKHFLKIFGIRISLSDVEEILKAQGYDCACAGSDDKLLIFVTKVDSHEKIEAMISEKTGINKNGFKVIEIKQIPRSDSGKILYAALEAMVG